MGIASLTAIGSAYIAARPGLRVVIWKAAEAEARTSAPPRARRASGPEPAREEGAEELRDDPGVSDARGDGEDGGEGWEPPDLGSMRRYGGGPDVYMRRRLVAVGLVAVVLILLLVVLLGGC